MKLVGRVTTSAAAVVCLAALALSVCPGLLNDLFPFVLWFGCWVIPLVYVAVGIYVCFRDIEVSRKHSAITLLILITTCVGLWFYIPRRVAFAMCRPSFQQLVDDGIGDDRELDRRIGPYHVDECLVDDRGGTYFRVHSGVDGFGPDTMSYGFCYNPNLDGSPFGGAQYGIFHLRDGWYWFRASDDWY